MESWDFNQPGVETLGFSYICNLILYWFVAPAHIKRAYLFLMTPGLSVMKTIIVLNLQITKSDTRAHKVDFQLADCIWPLKSYAWLCIVNILTLSPTRVEKIVSLEVFNLWWIPTVYMITWLEVQVLWFGQWEKTDILTTSLIKPALSQVTFSLVMFDSSQDGPVWYLMFLDGA